MSSDASVSLTLLDGFTLSHRGKPISLPLRAQRVLGFLAFQDLPVLRVYVAGSLWPDVPERRAAGSLRSALWRLSHLAFRVVDATPHTLRLAPSVVVDAREVVDWSRRVIHGSDETDLEGVRFPGELLPDWYDDWLPPHRERWRQTRLHSLESLARRMARAGRFAVAVDAALAAVRAEPLRESANRCLIEVHLAEGNVFEARRVLDLHRRAIRADLGIDPSPQLVALVDGSRHNGALTMR